MKGLVLAGNFREYVTWLHDNEFNRSDYPFIGSEDEDYIALLKADDQTPLYLVGSFRSRHSIYTLARNKFTTIKTDTLPLGFNADPDKYRETENTDTEEAYESD